MDNIIKSSYTARRRKNHRVSSHIHNLNEIVFYNSCTGTSIINGKSFEIKPNTFAIIPARTPHHEIHFKEGSLIYTSFRCEELPIEAGVYDDDTSGNFKSTSHQIWEEFQSNHDDKNVMLELLGKKLLLMLKRKATETTHSPQDLAFAKRYIEENFYSKIAFSSLAQKCGLGYDYFRHKFKAIYGISPQQHLINVRLEAAKNILETSSMNCTEIAYSCGFSDSAQFSTMYKKRFGITPKKNRAQNNE
jgi:AraC-like DNA-binding protein